MLNFESWLQSQELLGFSNLVSAAQSSLGCSENGEESEKGIRIILFLYMQYISKKYISKKKEKANQRFNVNL